MVRRNLLALVGLAAAIALAITWVSLSPTQTSGLGPDARALAGELGGADAIDATPDLAPSSEHAGLRSGRETPYSVEQGSQAPLRSGFAVLHVRVTALEDGRPLHHVFVSAWADGGARLASGQAVQTDEEGTADLEVPAGVELVVSAQGDGAMAGHASASVRALAPGERRDIALAVPAAADLVFCGRLLDRVSGDPIPDASIAALLAQDGSMPAGVTSGPDGSFQIELRSWFTRALQIDAPAHGRALVRPVAGHETPARALEIPLDRGATVVARVLRAEGSGVPGHTVELRTASFDLVRPSGTWIDGLGASTWSALSGTDGTAVLAGVTSGAPLRVGVRDGPAEIWSLAHPLVLAPGEARELACLIEAGAKIVGTVREKGGAPVAGLEIWLAPSRSEAPAFLGRIDEPASRRATSSAQGSFRFDAVPSGSWWVGPGISAQLEPEHDAAPLAVPVLVAQGATEIAIEIVVERGLTIRGRIVDSRGAPARFAWVQGWRAGTAQHVDATAGLDGAFVLGPLVAGEWELRASARGASAPSSPVTAQAGDADVVLRLSPGGSLRARVRDARGAPVAGAKVSATSAGPAGQVALITGADGLAVYESLSHGQWTLVATTSDGRLAFLTGVDVSGTNGAELDLVLAPGARARVKFAGPSPQGYLLVVRDEVVFDVQILLAGQTAEVTAPLGRSMLRMHAEAGGYVDREVDLRAGPTPEYVFDGGWK